MSNFCVCVSAFRSNCILTLGIPGVAPLSSPSYFKPAPSLQIVVLAFLDSTTHPQLFLIPTLLATMSSSSKKRTAAKKPQQPPSAPSPSTPATHIAFHKFIELANLNNITLFLTTAMSTPDGENLEFLWKRAFEEGQKVRLDKGHRFVDGMDIQEVLKAGVERGQAIGMAAERREWQTKGHGKNCVEAPPIRHFSTTATQATNPPPTQDIGSQTDVEPLTVARPP